MNAELARNRPVAQALEEFCGSRRQQVNPAHAAASGIPLRFRDKRPRAAAPPDARVDCQRAQQCVRIDEISPWQLAFATSPAPLPQWRIRKGSP